MLCREAPSGVSCQRRLQISNDIWQRGEPLGSRLADELDDPLPIVGRYLDHHRVPSNQRRQAPMSSMAPAISGVSTMARRSATTGARRVNRAPR